MKIKKFQIRMSEEEFELLEKSASKENRTKSNYIINLLKGEKKMENREMKNEMVKDITNSYLDKLEKEQAVTFTAEERATAVENAQDTLSQEEYDLPEEEFRSLITDWTEEARENFMDGK